MREDWIMDRDPGSWARCSKPNRYGVTETLAMGLLRILDQKDKKWNN